MRPPVVSALASMVRQRRTLRVAAHRPWPLPRAPWVMGQTWHHLLFAHWPVPVSALSTVVPPSLPLDTWEGSAWIAVTPFEVQANRLRLTPPVPYLSRFPEVNVRTYVTVGGKPGIYFLSLDAARAPAVIGARRTYRLPYFKARMSMSTSDGGVHYRSTRTSADGPPAELSADYGPEGEVFHAAEGTLERWLTERYCLYTLDQGQRVLRGEIHHPPWPLQAAAGRFEVNTMLAPYDLEPPGEPLLHFARRQDVVFWPLQMA